MKNSLFKRLAVIAVATTTASAFAIGPDLTPLTSSVDMGTTVTAVLLIAGSIATLYMVIRGAKTVLGMIRGR